MKELGELIKWLKNNNFEKAAEQIEEISDYEEDWHEEAISEFGGETVDEEQYFKDNMQSDNISKAPQSKEYPVVIEAILEKENFQTHATSGAESSFLGEGHFSSVFKGIYNGKPATIKVSTKLYDSFAGEVNDSEIWAAVLEAKANMPPEMSKHIPEVYHTNRSAVKDPKMDREIPYEVVIMEELYPLTEEMESLFTGYVRKSDEMLLNDEEYLFKLSKEITDELHSQVEFRGLFNHISPQDVFKVILGLGEIKVYSGTGEVSQSVGTYLFNSIDADKFAESFVSSGLDKYIGIDKTFDNHHEFLIDYIWKVVYPSIRRMSSPLTSRNDVVKNDGSKGRKHSLFWENMPETGTFYKMLSSLYENFNITWHDVHTGNIMQDAHGNLKIIDVGLYKI